LKNIRSTLFLLVTISTASAVSAQDKSFKTDAATGVQYRFIKHDKKAVPSSSVSDFARVIMLWTGENAKGNADTVYLDTHKQGGDSIGAITIPLKTTFHGSLEQGVTMMAIGDSAAFKINADSLYIKTFHAPAERIPHNITATTEFTFYIKLLGFKTNDDMMAERNAQIKKRQEQAGARKGQETKDITAYLQKNNLTAVKPDADSIFYLQATKGKGPQVKDGDSVTVKYSGTFLDGKVFDPGSQPFTLVYSKNAPVIQGWISVLGKMNGGDKVRVLIPSKMGYGSRGYSSIQPYTPLIFDMELISLKSHK
jgi:FKBP-type peptidyl-prolyl cis-trans isomerase FkpA